MSLELSMVPRLMLVIVSAVALASCQGSSTIPATTNATAAHAQRWRIAYAHGVTYAGVALGPQGDMWMCDGGFGTSLDRLTPDGRVEKYRLAYHPEQLTVGYDHAFWLTTDESTILRVTAAGKITPYRVTDQLAGGIVLGADHNVWFVEQYHIGRITPRGKLKEYELKSGSTHFEASGFSGIAWGPDGHLWFGAFGAAHYIVNLDPATGAIQIVGSGSESGGPVVSGPDGNIWYTDGFSVGSYQTMLVKLTMNGKSTVYHGPDDFIQAGTPQGLIVGPDGALWFVTQHIGGKHPHVIGGGLIRYDIGKNTFSTNAAPRGYEWEWGLAFDRHDAVWMSANNQAQVFASPLFR